MLKIADLLERRPQQLSGGQQQRVALGRAMVRQPAVFLMDEPLSNLDAGLRMGMRTELRDLHRRMQTTFVYVTHDHAEALTLSDRIAVMQDGVVQHVGNADEIYERPRNIFVASFLGNPRINLFSGTLVADRGEVRFRNGWLDLPFAREMASRLRPYAGSEVMLGVRPEDVRENASAFHATIAGRVKLVMPIGSDQLVGLHADHDVFFRVAKASRYQPGDKIVLEVNVDRLHVFDKGTKESLLA
jgi:multiple sugar transport system ATP-binding protein